MRKILWLSHELDLGGANKCLAEQIKILKDAGYDVSVIVIRNDSFARAVANDVTAIHEVYFYPWVIDLGEKLKISFRIKRLLRNALAVVQIFKIIIKTRPDYVATNTTTIPVAAVAAKLSFKKHAWFIHEFSEEDHGYKIFCGFHRGARLINWLSHKIVFNSEAVKHKYINHVSKQKVFIAHNPVIIPGIDNLPVLKHESGSPTIKCIILGQIAPSKNQMEALMAFDILHKQFGIVPELKIVGNTVNFEYADKIRGFIAENGLSATVRIVDYTNDPFSLIREADVLLMCSRMEAFGRVTVEALKLGVPVIAGNTGGSPEILTDGVNGYLYKTGNPQSLAEKIKLFSESYTTFNRGKIAADARLEYSEEHTKQELITIFS